MQTQQYVPATPANPRTILLGRNRLSSLATPSAPAPKAKELRSVPMSASQYVRKTLPTGPQTGLAVPHHPRLK